MSVGPRKPKPEGGDTIKVAVSERVIVTDDVRAELLRKTTEISEEVRLLREDVSWVKKIFWLTAILVILTVILMLAQLYYLFSGLATQG